MRLIKSLEDSQTEQEKQEVRDALKEEKDNWRNYLKNRN